MHELGIAEEIVAIAAEHAGRETSVGRETSMGSEKRVRVSRVVVEIGRLAAVLPDAVRFCFDACAEGTAVEGAELEIVEIPGRGKCRACAGEMELAQPFGFCACGGTDFEWLAGDELRVKRVEVLRCA